MAAKKSAKKTASKSEEKKETKKKVYTVFDANGKEVREHKNLEDAQHHASVVGGRVA